MKSHRGVSIPIRKVIFHLQKEHSRVHYIMGTVMEDEYLEKSAIKQAACCIILCDKVGRLIDGWVDR